MAILSMTMLKALQAAQRAGAVGLKYTVAGWMEEGEPHVYHNFTTVSALVERGDLSKQRALKGDGGRCHITSRGQQALKAALAETGR